MAVHYRAVKTVYSLVPVTLLLGQPNTYKTLLSKVTASLVGGLHREAIYDDVTLAKLTRLLDHGLFFVFNDPSRADVLKELTNV